MSEKVVNIRDYKRKDSYGRPPKPCKVFVLEREPALPPAPGIERQAFLNLLWLVNPTAAISLGLMFPGGIDDMGL